MDFYEWLDEVENHSLRRERLLDEFQELGPRKIERLLEWLEAAYRVGFENGHDDGYRLGMDNGRDMCD